MCCFCSPSQSTLIKVLLGDLQPVDGLVWLNSNVRIAYFTQHHVDQMNLGLTAVQVSSRLQHSNFFFSSFSPFFPFSPRTQTYGWRSVFNPRAVLSAVRLARDADVWRAGSVRARDWRQCLLVLALAFFVFN